MRNLFKYSQKREPSEYHVACKYIFIQQDAIIDFFNLLGSLPSNFQSTNLHIFTCNLMFKSYPRYTQSRGTCSLLK